MQYGKLPPVMKIQISDHFTFKKLIRFVLPSIAMIIATSLYGNVDGFFVTNWVGETPFAAINLSWPLIMIFGGVGFVFGTGGSAVVATALGENEADRANQNFSLIIYFGIALGILLGAIGFIFAPQFGVLLGADGELLKCSIKYMRILFCFTPAFILQNMFQSLCSTASKPKLGLDATIIAGVGNIVLDAIFIVGLKWGLVGAAIGTAMSQFFGGIVPLIFFARENDTNFKLCIPKFHRKVITKTCTNGVSEFVNNLTLSIVIILYNLKLMEIAGQNGVNAFGIIQYINFTFISVFIGIVMGSAPIISFNNGANDYAELQNVFKKEVTLLLSSGVILFGLAELLSKPFVYVFIQENKELFDMSVHGLRIFCIAFLLMGFNMLGSSLFTALENGGISAVIAFIRSFVFPIAALYTIPTLLGNTLDSVWICQIIIEAFSFVMVLSFILGFRKRYKYL